MKRYSMSTYVAVALLAWSNLGLAYDSKKDSTIDSKHLTMLDIVDMASDFEHDSLEALADRITDLGGKPKNDGYEVYLKTLSDGTTITSAQVMRRSGKVADIRIVVAENTCFPIRTAVWRSYAAGPIYSHDDGRYETVTRWTKFAFVPRPPGTCLSSLNVERPSAHDYESEHMVPAKPRSALTVTEMDTLLWLLTGDADPGLGNIYEIVEGAETAEPEITFASALQDKYRITLAKKTKVPDKPFALILGFSDKPCYPLGRALALTRTRIEPGAWPDDAARFHSVESDINTTVYPHSHSPLCLGFIRAYDG